VLAIDPKSALARIEQEAQRGRDDDGDLDGGDAEEDDDEIAA
jgi:hypothetical protein